MKEKKSMGIGAIVFIILSVLKLSGVEPVVSWSWLWITSIIWIPLCIVIVLLLISLMLNKDD